MQSPEPIPDHSYNLANELAKERTRAAADRTLMAWIRTSLSLISFGFGIPTIVNAIKATQLGQNINSFLIPSAVGLAFISTGIYAMFNALQEHRKILHQIRSDRYVYQSSNFAYNIGLALCFIGLASFVAILIEAINP